MKLRTIAHMTALTMIASTVLAACIKVPVTGRRQFNLIPDGIMQQIGASSYQTMLADENVTTGSSNAKAIKKVGEAIADAANQKDYNWKFKLIQDNDTINAWCLPGGKIAVYSGLLPVVESEAGLAFVMGHEVGHATAHHGAERVSQQLAVLGGMAGLYLYLDNKSELNDKQKATVIAAAGVGAQGGVILPFSRLHEKEADVIGMMYMAKAGYPPSEAPGVWDRMEEASGGSMPTILSTHPSNENRKENLRDWMPQAKKRWNRSSKRSNTAQTLWTNRDF